MSSCLSISLKLITNIWMFVSTAMQKRSRSFKVFSFNAKLLVIVSPIRYVGFYVGFNATLVLMLTLNLWFISKFWNQLIKVVLPFVVWLCSLYCTQCTKNEVFQETTDLVTFTEETLDENYQFLCNESIYSCKEQIYLNA